MSKRLLSLAVGLTAALPAVANNADNFREHDHFGLMMTVIAMGVVFSALLILFLCFKWADKAVNILLYNLFVRPYRAMGDSAFGQWFYRTFIASWKSKGNTIPYQSDMGFRQKKTASGQAVASTDEAAVAAAIGVALFLAEDGMHDAEADVLTMVPQAATGWTGVGNNQKRMPLRKF